MTGYRSPQLRHVCERAGCYLQQLPNWRDIVDCFDDPNKPHPIRPTDIDGMVEIGGRFMFLEEKRAGVAMPTGQRIAFQRLADAGDVTVVVMRPVTPVRSADEVSDPLEVMVYPGYPRWRRMSREEFLRGLRRWSESARLRRAG